MNLIKLLEPLGIIGGVHGGTKLRDVEITDVVFDSRKVKPGCLFVCIKGSAQDGHDFAVKAVETGAVCVVAEREMDLGVPVITLNETTKVRDSRQALALISAAFFNHPAREVNVICITGTKGKTTTAIMLRSILEAAGHKTGVIGTLGVLIGGERIAINNTTPSSYEVQMYLRKMADAGCEYCVMEASSIGLKDYRIFGFEAEIGLFTNFSEDHIGGVEHPNMQDYLESKRKLFRLCKVGVVNIDDESWREIIEGHTAEIKTYGFSPNAQMRGEDYRLMHRPGILGSTFHVAGEREFITEVGLPGKFNAYNALGAIAVCHELGVNEDDINRGLVSVKVKGRAERASVDGDYTLLIDYAHNAVSMESILSTLREYKPQRLICLFGAGGNRSKVRRYEMGEVSGRLADLSVITSDNPRFEEPLDIIEDIKTGIVKTEGKYIVIPDRIEAIHYVIENAEAGDIIVLAGKGQEDYQEIKGVKHHLDEREVIAEFLEKRKRGRI